MEQDIAAQLRALNDRQAITDLLHTYCRAVDRMDAEMGKSIWNTGAEADYGEGVYRGSGHGLINYVLESHRNFEVTSHHLSNIMIRLEGEQAGSEAYVSAALRFAENGQIKQVNIRGRYIDRLSRRNNGRWGIDRRIYLNDCDEMRIIAASLFPTRGSRDRRDPSYQALDG